MSVTDEDKMRQLRAQLRDERRKARDARNAEAQMRQRAVAAENRADTFEGKATQLRAELDHERHTGTKLQVEVQQLRRSLRHYERQSILGRVAGAIRKR